jgi:hypothetical protein
VTAGSRKPASRLRPRLPAALLLILAAAACVKFTPPALEKPAAVLERFLFCASVDQKEDWAEPGPDQAVFAPDEDGQVFAFAAFRDLRGPHTLGWKWYAPSGKLRRAPEAIPIGEEGKSFASYIAWDAVPLGPETERGTWTVTLFLDGALLTEKRFEVR